MIAAYATALASNVLEICAVKFDPDRPGQRWEFFEDGTPMALSRVNAHDIHRLAPYAEKVVQRRLTLHSSNLLELKFEEFRSSDPGPLFCLRKQLSIFSHLKPTSVDTLFFDPRRDSGPDVSLATIHNRLSLAYDAGERDAMKIACQIATVIKESMTR